MDTFINDLYVHFLSKNKKSHTIPTTFNEVGQLAIHWDSYHGYGPLVSCYKFGKKIEVFQYEIACGRGYFRRPEYDILWKKF